VRRYWVPKQALADSQAVLDGEIFHHIFDVCRQEVGSRFELLCGDQKAYLVEVTDVGKKSAKAQILSQRQIPPLPTPHLHLALSIPRFPVMEAVIEKAVEMGVHTLHPFFSDFSFVRKAASLPAAKLERWKKIIVSASQQCGRGELMSLAQPQDLSAILQNFAQNTNPTKGRLGLFAYEGQTHKNVREHLKSIGKEDLTEVWVFVGSEGGFSPAEVHEFQRLTMEPVTLGEQVLRVETACITLLAVLKYEFELF